MISNEEHSEIDLKEELAHMKRRLEQATNKNIALEKMMRRLERDCLQMDNSDGEFERENLEIILS